MKKTVCHILFIFFLSSLSKSQTNIPNKGNISVCIKGCQLNKGKVVIALLNTKKSYLSTQSKPYKYAYLRNVYRYTFKDIPYGTYAIQLYYDQNDNDKLDMTFGIPREKYGFSNNARKYFSKPSYQEVCFTLRQSVVIQHIVLK